MTNLHVQDRTLIAGFSKSRQSKIQWLDTTVPVGLPGQFTEINLVGFTVTFSGSRLTITGSGGGGQAALQFEDEGTPLGTPGTVDTLNFVGANVAATRVGNVVTVTVTSSGSGTVTSVSSGDLSPLFTVVVSNPTTTPAFAFTAVNQNANLVYAGPATGAAAAPTFRALTTADVKMTAGLSFRIGRQDGAVLLANFQRVFILPCAYDQITTGAWELYTYPGSTCVIDVQYIAFGTADPTTANSIVGGVQPATSGGQTSTGVTSGWTASLARGGFIAIQVLSNDLAREIRFFMPGRKVI